MSEVPFGAGFKVQGSGDAFGRVLSGDEVALEPRVQ